MENKKKFPITMSSIEGAAQFIHNQLKKHQCTKRDILRAQLFSEETFVLM